MSISSRRVATGLLSLAILCGLIIAGPASARRPSSGAGKPVAVPLRILAVGDSITAPCAEPYGWCTALASLLADRGVPATVTVVGVPGASCGGLIAPLQAALAVADFDLMILNCGTNNDTSNAAARGALGWQWRTLVETARVDGTGATMILPVLIQYSEPKIQTWQGRQWLIDGEARANDVIYSQWGYYDPAGWFAGKLDLQQIPATRSYLIGGTDGIHPNARGHAAMAALTYRALRGHYGWPDTVPLPCEMWGARPDPAYQQYVGSYEPCD